MNYRAAAIYANKPPAIIKQEFENILEALKDAYLNSTLSKELIDFWLHGSPLVNYEMILETLNAKKILLEAGIPGRYLSTVLKTDTPIDHYTLFKNICLYNIGEEFTPDFQIFVIEPIHKIYIEPTIIFEKLKTDEQQKADKTISAISVQLKKSIKDLESLNTSMMAGTVQETIMIQLININSKIDEFIPKVKNKI